MEANSVEDKIECRRFYKGFYVCVIVEDYAVSLHIQKVTGGNCPMDILSYNFNDTMTNHT